MLSPRAAAIERLEDRTLLAVFLVDTTADTVDANPGDGIAVDANNRVSLRAAIMEANALAGSDSIVVPQGDYTLTIAGVFENLAATGDLDITDTLTIAGAGADLTTVDAAGIDRVFDVAFSTTVNFYNLTITGGQAVGDNMNILEDRGGGLRIDFSANVLVAGVTFIGNSAPRTDGSLVFGLGGAIESAGSLTIRDSRFENNLATNAGGAISSSGGGASVQIDRTSFVANASRAGGAIENHETMVINTSTFSANHDNGSGSGNGGAINNNGGGTLTLTNSTLSGNDADLGGGLINFGSATIQSSTITGNTADSGGGILHSGTSMFIGSTIVAGNTASVSAPDVDGMISSLDHNLIGDTTGSSGFGQPNDLLNISAMLGPLADNGGPTQTHAPQAGSQAIDNANNATAPATDQRGVARPIGGTADIGAVEVQPAPVTYLVDTLLDEDDGDHSVNDLSLREAIGLSNASASNDIIEFHPAFSGGTIVLANALRDFDITDDVTITGLGAGSLTIDANDVSRIFTIDGVTNGPIEVTISGLTLLDGVATGVSPDNLGGAIYNEGAHLTLDDVELLSHQATQGGAIYSIGGSPTMPAVVNIVDSTLTGNSTGNQGGGAIYNDGNVVMTITRSTISGNSSSGLGGGIFTTTDDSTGLNGHVGTLTIVDSTVSGNMSTGFNGAGGAIRNNFATLIISGSTFSGNSAATDGGAISMFRGTVDITNSTFSGNSADREGGAINPLGARLTVNASTIVGNRADADDDSANDLGGGINTPVSSPPSFTFLQNTIVAGNLIDAGAGTPSDLSRQNIEPGSTHNLIGDAASSAGLMDGVDGNIVGNGGVGTIALNTILDPTLADNTGPTQTHALVGGSPAIDAADPADSPATDQRGVSRPQGPGSDIGAFEVLVAQTFVVDTLSDVSDGDFSAGNFSLREAIEQSNLTPPADTITFAAALSGGTIILTGTALSITDSVTINGLGQNQLTINGNNLSQIFVLSGSTNDVTIDGLTLTQGQGVDFGGAIHADINHLTITNSTISNSTTTGATGRGAGLFSTNGDLTLTSVTFDGNSASGDGGGLYFNTVSAVAMVSSSTFMNNSAGSSFDSGGAIHNRGTMSVADSTFTNNSASGAGAIANGLVLTVTRSTFSGNSAGQGGAISSFEGQVGGPSELTIIESTLSGNTATSGAGALDVAGDSILIRDSTISGNTAGTNGGAIILASSMSVTTLTIINSTISGNSADNVGGGILNGNVLVIRNSTIVGNRSDADGSNGAPGGGIFSNNSATPAVLHNTLVAGNVSGSGAGTPDDLGTMQGGNPIGQNVDPVSSHNLIGDAATAGGLSDGVNGNIVGNGGVGTITLATILDPSLTDNGGPTLTHALVTGSPAIDTGDNAQAVDENSVALSNDQRGTGFSRIIDGDGDLMTTVDIGAIEFDLVPQTIIVDTLVDESDGDFTAGDLSLREAIELSNASITADVIQFDASLTGGTITLGGSELLITDDVTITGLGAGQLTVSGNMASRIFHVDGVSGGPITVDIDGLTLTGGLASGPIPDSRGGAIYNDGADVALTSSVVTGNTADYGGGLSSGDGTLTVTGTTISGNTANIWGGGIANFQADVFLTNVTLDGNMATLDAGAIYAVGSMSDQAQLTLSNVDVTGNTAAEFAGGIELAADVTLVITDSLLSGNQATGGTGAAGALLALNNSDITILDSTITNNSADSVGGGLFIGLSNVRVERTTISDNMAGDLGGGIAFSDVTNATGMTITGSTISGNTAATDGGGLIAEGGVHTIINSTISGNTAAGVGGGLEDRGATFVIRSSTITGNRADSDGNSSSAGGGIFLTNTATNSLTTLHNTIVAGNVSGMAGADVPDDVNTATGAALVGTSSDNLIGDAATSGGLTDGVNGNIVGNSGAGTVDINTVLDPTLADNGGPTQTHALVNGSPAIDAGDNSEAVDENSVALSSDQRQSPFGRIADGDGDTTATTDIGAFEWQSLSLVVDTLLDESDGDFSALDLALREAIELANLNPGDDVVGFAGALSGGTIILGGTELLITDGVEINGLGAANLTINANALSRIFHIDATAAPFDVLIDGLTLTGGDRSNLVSDDRGGAIWNRDARLTLSNSNLTGNAADLGGGVYTQFTTFTRIDNVTFSSNHTTQHGAALHAQSATVEIVGSSFTMNNADLNGGAIYATSADLAIMTTILSQNTAGAGGGALFGLGGSLVLSYSTVNDNEADGDGGGLDLGSMSATIFNSTISGNSARQNGGGITTGNTVTIINSTITGNRANDANDSSSFTGGGIRHDGGVTTLYNTIVAGNDRIDFTVPTADDIRGPDINLASANNVIGDAATAAGLVDGLNGNIVGNAGSGTIPIGNILDTTLANNGGPTLTHDLVGGSPAIDNGDTAQALDDQGNPLDADQRFYVRVIGTSVDIGAVESGSVPLPPASATALAVNGSMNPNRSGVQYVAVLFNQAVTVSGAGALALFNHTTTQLIPVPGATLADNGTRMVTWNLNGTVLPTGRYTAELLASAATNITGLSLAGSFAAEFFVVRGDVTGDGVVNASDFVEVDANFDPLPGTPFRAGDANGDGLVNASDFVEVDANFNPIPLPLLEFDFGDAPEAGTSFPTTLANNGAGHVITGNALFLGASRDAEVDGQPDPAADGDGADEDGIDITGNLIVEANVAVTVTSSGDGFVNGWVDFNQDGDWDDPGEQVFSDEAVVAGANNLQIAVPGGAMLGNTFARFRLTAATGYSYFGLATNGEVEDYQLTVAAPPTARTSNVERPTSNIERVDMDEQNFDVGRSMFDVRRSPEAWWTLTHTTGVPYSLFTTGPFSLFGRSLSLFEVGQRIRLRGR